MSTILSAKKAFLLYTPHRTKIKPFDSEIKIIGLQAML